MYYTASPTQTLYYEQHGAGPPLLLLHGFTGSAQNWQPLIPALACNHRVVVLDLPGHGRSSAPSDSSAYAMPVVAAQLAALLDHLGHESAHLLGYSMGGRLALYLALHHPQRWRSLVLESSSPGLKSDAERQARRAADESLAAYIEQEGIASFVARWEALPLFASQQQLPASLREAHRAQRLRNAPRGLANSLRGMGTGVQPSLWQRLEELGLPTLLVAGSLDQKFVAIAEQMAARISHSRLAIVPDAGHTVHLERPNSYSRLLQDWLHKIE